MKKLFLLLLLCPIMAMANRFNPGTVFLNNGSTATGWIATPETSDQELEFRNEEHSSTQHYAIDKVKKFTLIINNEEQTFYPIRIATQKMFKKELSKPSAKKYWTRMVAQGNTINIVRTYFFNTKIAGQPNSEANASYVYYFWKPENDYGTYITVGSSNNINPCNHYNFKEIKYATEICFGKECPVMIEKLNEQDLLANGLQHLIQLYDENCGTTK